ncbi:hypothetical protein SAMN05216428_102348 [Nitrosospira sp. Nsp11]|nr:hypothetical protein SAMN05216428_102348 [Nitrosospira sp. Nsp11]
MLGCKPNDLAMVLRGPYSGHFVTVKEFIGTSLLWRPVNTAYELWDRLWKVDAPTIPLNGFRVNCIPDEYLFPIRPGDLKEVEETEKEIESV